MSASGRQDQTDDYAKKLDEQSQLTQIKSLLIDVLANMLSLSDELGHVVRGRTEKEQIDHLTRDWAELEQVESLRMEDDKTAQGLRDLLGGVRIHLLVRKIQGMTEIDQLTQVCPTIQKNIDNIELLFKQKISTSADSANQDVIPNNSDIEALIEQTRDTLASIDSRIQSYTIDSAQEEKGSKTPVRSVAADHEYDDQDRKNDINLLNIKSRLIEAIHCLWRMRFSTHEDSLVGHGLMSQSELYDLAKKIQAIDSLEAFVEMDLKSMLASLVTDIQLIDALANRKLKSFMPDPDDIEILHSAIGEAETAVRFYVDKQKKQAVEEEKLGQLILGEPALDSRSALKTQLNSVTQKNALILSVSNGLNNEKFLSHCSTKQKVIVQEVVKKLVRASYDTLQNLSANLQVESGVKKPKDWVTMVMTPVQHIYQETVMLPEFQALYNTVINMQSSLTDKDFMEDRKKLVNRIDKIMKEMPRKSFEENLKEYHNIGDIRKKVTKLESRKKPTYSPQITGKLSASSSTESSCDQSPDSSLNVRPGSQSGQGKK